MNTKEIQAQIKDIKKTIAPLREGVSKAFEEHSPERYREMPIFMTPLLDAPLYAELHQLNAEFKQKSDAVFKTYQEATDDLRRIEGAINKGLIYMDLVTADEDIDLDELRATAKKNTDNLRKIMRELEVIRTDLHATAWDIYFNTLDADTLLSDAKSIASAFKIEKEDKKDSGEEPEERRKSMTRYILERENSLPLIGDFETENIEGHPRYLLPSAFSTLDETKKRASLEPIIMAYFSEYRETLKKKDIKGALFEIDSSVSRLLAKLSDSKNTLTVRPKTFYADNTKVGLQFDEVSTDYMTRMKIGKYKGEEVYIQIALSNESGSPYNPDESDKELYNVVLTIWETFEHLNMLDGETASVPLELVYQIYRKNFNARLDPQTAEEFEKRLLNFNTNIRLDASAGSVLYPELASFDNKRGSIVNIMIEGKKINGVYARAVNIIALDKSPKYSYAKITKQITATPMGMLETTTKGKTNDNVLIEAYLRERIETTKDQGYEILTEKIFKHAEIDLAQYKNPKDKRAKTIKKIKDTLTDFQNNGYLALRGFKGWHFEKIGRDPYYKIVLEKGKKQS